MNLDPAGSLLDGFPVVIWPPALDKGHPENTEPPQIIHSDPCGGIQ